MPFLSLTDATYAALRLLRLPEESDDLLIRRILKFARCYMVLIGMEEVEKD